MLILTRKIEEEIKIGSDVTIKVLSISEGQVKLGISAPGNVAIFRSEIYEKVKMVTIEASESCTEKPKDLSKLKIRKISDEDERS
jgi:carbon storage regulator